MSASILDNSPDKVGNCPHPRDTHVLFGHEAAEQSFLQAMNDKKLHHAWLIQGPKGCGKATLAYRVARRLAGAGVCEDNGVLGSDPNQTISQQISAGSYPDLLVVSRQWNEKTKKWNNEINVNQIRKISKLYTHRASGNGWRVCIIDCADDLNHNAANALLKILEEPPEKGLLLLVCNNPGRLLSTLRSRCRSLKLRAPGVEIATRIAVNCGAELEKAVFASELCQGSPGRTAQIANGNAGELWGDIEEIFKQLPQIDRVKVNSIAAKLATKSARQSLGLFFELLTLRHKKEIKNMALSGDLQQIEPWEKMLGVNHDLQLDINRINLDPAQVVQQIIFNISKAAEQAQLIKMRLTDVD
ncbi:MAG: DNA polymerase III subunit delta' [Robiginitomaculum sp.]|nr:DNA polymerase III subunit delta' [Robiginitomaculum sp.]